MKFYLTNYIGLPTEKDPKPYKTGLKQLNKWLNELLKDKNGKTIKIETIVEIH